MPRILTFLIVRSYIFYFDVCHSFVNFYQNAFVYTELSVLVFWFIYYIFVFLLKMVLYVNNVSNLGLYNG